MPLYINTTRIDYLNGPTTMNYLVPVEGKIPHFKNHILLFGDTHTTERFQYCKSSKYKNCYELQTQFVEELNKFAGNHPVYFYFENFMPSLKQNQAKTEITRIENEGSTMMRQINDKIKVGETSNLVDMMKLYKNCFLNRMYPVYNCQYANIKWQHADIRLYDISLLQNRIRNKPRHRNDDIEYLLSTGDMDNIIFVMFEPFITRLYEKDPTALTDMVNKDVPSKYYLRLKNSEIFVFLKTLLYEPEVFVQRLFDSYSYRKQIEKMDDITRQIFTHASFVKYIEFLVTKGLKHYVSVGLKNKQAINEIVKLLDLLIVNADDEQYVENFNYTLSSDLSIKDIEYIIAYMDIIRNSALDIYFILRMYSERHEKEDEKVFNLGYLGSFHTRNIAYYLTNMMKTHREVFQARNDIRTKTKTDIRRIHITKNINLDDIWRRKQIHTRSMRVKTDTKSRSRSRSSSRSKSRSSSRSKSITNQNYYNVLRMSSSEQVE